LGVSKTALLGWPWILGELSIQGRWHPVQLGAKVQPTPKMNQWFVGDSNHLELGIYRTNKYWMEWDLTSIDMI
jgi:hypothetical protein